MFEIIAREDLTATTYLLEVAHPRLARAARPGQFVIVMAKERGERIPLTIADFDRTCGTITLVVQAVGKTTLELQQSCRAGEQLFAVVGPMGRPTEARAWRKIVGVGGGLGVAPLYPQLRAFRAQGAHVIGVIGFRTAALAFWEDRFAKACDELVVCTDDGSRGFSGRVSDALDQVLARHPDVEQAVVIGPPVMMRACAETTRPHGVPTLVSLNPIMVDGTGMCGGCRVTVGGQVRFACVDGPDFDAHQVDFDELITRLRRFAPDERLALARWRDGCRLVANGAVP
jgi:NAD(P)H-flavin reductase